MNFKNLAAAAALALATQAPAWAVNIPMPNTGNGSQVGGTVDTNWSFQNSLGTGQTQVLSPSLANWYFDWVPNDATSSWVGVSATDTQSYPSPLVFTATFNLSPYVLSSVAISGSWSVDDAGVLLVNGNFLSFLPTGSWNQMHSFTVANNLLVQGVNRFTVVLTENDNYLEGVRLAAVATGNLLPVPEPENWAMMLSGLGLFGLVIARRRTR